MTDGVGSGDVQCSAPYWRGILHGRLQLSIGISLPAIEPLRSGARNDSKVAPSYSIAWVEEQALPVAMSLLSADAHVPSASGKFRNGNPDQETIVRAACSTLAEPM